MKSIGINNNAIKLDYDLKPDYYERSSEDSDYYSDYYSDDSEGTEYWWEEYLSPAGIAALGLGGVFEDLRKAAKAKFERTHATTVKLCDRRTRVEIKEKSLQEVCKDFNIQVKSIAGEVHFCEKKDKLGLIFYAKGLKRPVYDTSRKLRDAIKIAGLSKKIRNGCPSWTKGEGKSEIEKVYSGLTVNPSNCVFWRMSFFAKDYEKLVSNLQSIGIKKRAIKVARDEEFLYADWYKGKYNKNDHYGIYNDNIDEYAYNRKYKCDPRVGYAEACLSEKGMEIFGIKSAVQKLKDDTIIMKVVEE